MTDDEIDRTVLAQARKLAARGSAPTFQALERELGRHVPPDQVRAARDRLIACGFWDTRWPGAVKPQARPEPAILAPTPAPKPKAQARAQRQRHRSGRTEAEIDAQVLAEACRMHQNARPLSEEEADARIQAAHDERFPSKRYAPPPAKGRSLADWCKTYIEEWRALRRQCRHQKERVA